MGIVDKIHARYIAYIKDRKSPSVVFLRSVDENGLNV